MKVNNKLDKSFGPVGTSAGIFLFVLGIITLYSSWFGLILVIVDAGAATVTVKPTALEDLPSGLVAFTVQLSAVAPSLSESVNCVLLTKVTCDAGKE